MNKKKTPWTLVLAGTTVIATGWVHAPSLAQENAAVPAAQVAPAADAAPVAGTELTFGISTTLRSDDNYGLDEDSPGTTTLLDTRLSFGVVTATPLDRLTIDIDGVLRLGDFPETGFDSRFDDPGLRLGYVREGANARFTTQAELRRTDLFFLDPLDLPEDFDDNDLTTTDQGTRELLNASIGLETGLNDPLGFNFELSRRETRYTDTDDPDLYDRRTDRAAVGARLNLSPVAIGRIDLSQEEFTAEDPEETERQTRELRLGLSYAINPVTTLDASVGIAEIEETLGAVPVTTTDEGTTASLALTRELANGSAGIAFDQSFSLDGGERQSLSVNRSLNLPGGALSTSIGASQGESGETSAIAGLDYTQEIGLSTISASLDRSVRTNDDGEDVLATRGELGYSYALDRLSNLTFDFGYAEIDDAGEGAVDRAERSNFRAAYERSLTEDWNVAAGYEYRRSFTEGEDEATSNAVFLTLERVFVTRR